MKNKYIKYILIFIISYSTMYCQIDINANSKITNEQSRMLKQAKSLESSGLLDESIVAYSNILNKYPKFQQAFNALKSIYLRKKNWEALTIEADKYIKASNTNSSKIDVFDVYLITNNPKWEVIINNFYNQKQINLSYMKKLISILLSNNKKEVAINWIKKVRQKTKKNNFYSLEMGMYHALKLNYKDSIDEYLLYLEYSPNNIEMIIQRIMLLTDYEISNDIIKKKLEESNTRESKIILSQLEFKLKNYIKAYNLITEIKNSDNYKIDFIDDLIKINEFELAQDVINDLISSSKNKTILNKAILQLASLYEMQITNSINEFTIINDIYDNKLLTSPFLTLNSNYSDLLFKAIDIYDSLSTYKKDYKSSFQLAEIKYKFQGDLDGAKEIYENIYNNYSSNKYKQKSLNAIIDIYLSKGDINNAIKKINSMYNYKINNNKLNQTLDIKKVQVYFYNMNRDSVIYYSEKVLKELPMDNEFYNDILKISSLFHIYSDKELLNYADAKFKIIQNKRTQAIEILNKISKENPVFEIAQFESIFLESKQENYQLALERIKTNQDIITSYKEQLMILEAEIYDHGLNSKSQAVDIYLNFLDTFPQSIFYDLIRLRLRELST